MLNLLLHSQIFIKPYFVSGILLGFRDKFKTMKKDRIIIKALIIFLRNKKK